MIISLQSRLHVSILISDPGEEVRQKAAFMVEAMAVDPRQFLADAADSLVRLLYKLMGVESCGRHVLREDGTIRDVNRNSGQPKQFFTETTKLKLAERLYFGKNRAVQAEKAKKLSSFQNRQKVIYAETALSRQKQPYFGPYGPNTETVLAKTEPKPKTVAH